MTIRNFASELLAGGSSWICEDFLKISHSKILTSIQIICSNRIRFVATRRMSNSSARQFRQLFAVETFFFERQADSRPRLYESSCFSTFTCFHCLTAVRIRSNEISIRQLNSIKGLSEMVDASTRKTLSSIPLLQTKAGPRDKELWVQRLKEEYQALIKVLVNLSYSHPIHFIKFHNFVQPAVRSEQQGLGHGLVSFGIK